MCPGKHPGAKQGESEPGPDPVEFQLQLDAIQFGSPRRRRIGGAGLVPRDVEAVLEVWRCLVGLA
jgi:hypothetical protein